MFVFHMSVHRKFDSQPLSTTTIDGYVSHVVFHLTEFGIIDTTTDIRCPSTQRLLPLLTLKDAERLGPLRLRINIAVSLPIIDAYRIQALTLFPCPVTRVFIPAALYIGFTLSLRPGDNLYPFTATSPIRMVVPLWTR